MNDVTVTAQPERLKPWLLFGYFPLAGLLVFAVLASWSAEAFDDVLLVFTAAPSITAGAATTAILAFGHVRRSGRSRAHALRLALASVAIGAVLGLAVYVAMLAWLYLYMFAG